MYFRSILSGTLAILLMTAAGAKADERGGLFNAWSSAESSREGGISLPSFGLPKLFGKKDNGGGVLLAQAGDPRITALEEQIRSLSGTIEELNFQILQMQEQMRKMQEDNEFRFQELEQKKTDAGAPNDSNVANAPAAPQPGSRQAAAGNGEQATGGIPMEPDVSLGTEVLVENGTGDPAGNGSLAEPPRDFGTITFDEKGNVTGGSTGGDTTQSVSDADGQATVRQALPAPNASGTDLEGAPATEPQTQVAALPSTDNPEDLYRNSYEFILSGDYSTAEAGFRDHIERFPSDPKGADAHFWLGESLLGQKKYRDAAEVFLAANKQYPSSKKAPDMLLKLGISLVGLDQRDVACATFSEVNKRYPNASGALKERIKQEQALATC
jgi:tol-pal system protein YbgF